MSRISIEVDLPPWKNVSPTRIREGEPAITLRNGKTYEIDEQYFDPSVMRKVEVSEEDLEADSSEEEAEEADDAPDADESSPPESDEAPESEESTDVDDESSADLDQEEGTPYPDGEPNMNWLKDELQAYAQEVGVATSGTKADILERIEDQE